MNKAQATGFAIMGILIAAMIVAAIFISQQDRVGTRKDIQMSSVRNYVKSCIDQVAIPGIYLLGLQGGQIFIDRPFVNLTDINTVYGYYENRNVLVSKQELEHQLARYMEVQLPSCLSDFETIKQQGTNISYDNITAEVVVGQEDVTFNLEFPIKVKTKVIEQRVNKFSRKFDIRLGHVHDIANNIIEKQKETGYDIEVSYFTKFDVDIDLSLVDKENLIYKIQDPVSVENNAEFVFMFGAKSKANKAPVLKLADKYELVDDEPFYLEIEVEDDNSDLKFEADTSLFTIENGIIDFTPKITGEYNVTIYVEDPHGAFDEKTVLFVVKENK